ncbi:MAG: HAD family phosphatase [Spirulinaceae cyanobacterium RM2_2_10]|nr:HAD family phosphatase [Spirulinaceae cyanobacterium SM2_1_0]NJO19220.1 HAD family phosphatase [Spirulinaceae cyanobacterium RM2_2_10]
MSLQAVLFDFNGVIVNDEALHEELFAELMLSENLRLFPQDFREVCLGRSDRAALRALLGRRGRVATDAYLDQLIAKKAQAYQQRVSEWSTVPSYPDVPEFITQLQTQGILTALVTGATRADIEAVLARLELADCFAVSVTGDEARRSKPDPYSYHLALERLNRQFPERQIKPQHCLAIEQAPAGISAAKQAGIQVVGVANTYPFHMLQRLANWTVDRLGEIELERVEQVVAHSCSQARNS